MVLLGAAAAVVNPALGGIVYIAGYFLIPPLFANRLYYRHAMNKTARAQLSNADPQSQALEAARLGGTSAIVLVILPIVMVGMLGMMAAIAIPAYQDYTIRAQVSEGLKLSSGAKAAVTEFIQDTGSVPVDNAQAGLAAPCDISGQYTSAIEVYQGEVSVTYGNDAHQILQGRVLYLVPDNAGGFVEWTCSSNDIANKHLPAACR